MGMPISLALRGRHADDAAGRAAWAAAIAVLREADRVFSTYRADSVDLPARPRRARGWTTAPPRSPRSSPSAPRAERDVRRRVLDVRRRGADGRRVLDPSGVVKGWAVERARRGTARAAAHRLLPLRRRRPVCRTLDPDAAPGGSASRTRTTPAGWSPSSRCATAPSPPPARPTAAPTSSTPAPACRPPASPRSPSSRATLT